MSLVIENAAPKFNLEECGIKLGTLVWAKMKTWDEGQGGFVCSVSDSEIVIQYQPGISNVTNHYKVTAEEVVADEWETIRWSNDLEEISCYPEQELPIDVPEPIEDDGESI